MSFIIIITLYLVTSIILKRSLKYFKNFYLLDFPTARSNHKTPKPKGAGLILIPLIIFATLLVFFFRANSRTLLVNYFWILHNTDRIIIIG